MSEPRAPAHLSKASRALWRRIVGDYELEPHHLVVLRLLLEAVDRASDAEVILRAEGLVVRDRFGQTRAHPMIGVKRDAEISAARLLRELDLDAEVSREIRLPRIGAPRPLAEAR